MTFVRICTLLFLSCHGKSTFNILFILLFTLFTIPSHFVYQDFIQLLFIGPSKHFFIIIFISSYKCSGMCRILLKTFLKLPLQRGYIKGLRVELMYPSHMVNICRSWCTHFRQNAMTMKAIK